MAPAGGSGKPGRNNQALGKILIVSQDNNSASPDDNAGGGTLIFTFDLGVRMDDVYMLDIDDEPAAGVVRAYSDVGGSNLLAASKGWGLGDNSLQVAPVNATGVRRLEIQFPASGAIPAIVSCRNANTALYDIGDTIWSDANSNGQQDEGEQGIKDVKVEMYAAGMSQALGSATTNGAGKYRFNNLPAGSYTVKIPSANFDAGMPLEGAVATTLNAGDDALDSDFSGGSAAAVVPLADGNNLTIDGGFILPSGVGGEGAETATININDNKDSQYEIQLQSQNGNTWTYRVRKRQGWDLQNWMLELSSCEGHIQGYNPSGSYGHDDGAGFTGLKWGAAAGDSDQFFSITLDNAYPRRATYAWALNHKGSAQVPIAGPDCSQIADTGGGDEGGGTRAAVRAKRPCATSAGSTGTAAATPTWSCSSSWTRPASAATASWAT